MSIQKCWRLLGGVVLFCGGFNSALFSSTGHEGAQADFPAAHLTSHGEVSLEGKVQLSSQGKIKGALVLSGNKISVRSGNARLELMLGGSLRLMDESELAILQNHSPYLFTLSKGSVAFDLDSSQGDSFFTPDFVIKTLSEGSSVKNKHQGELTVGVDGVVCLHSRTGNLMITTQDGQNFLILPAGGSMQLHPGDVVNQPMFYSQACSCLKPSGKPWNDFGAAFGPSRPPRSLWGRISLALRQFAHIASFGLL
jgi:hypothetical protein